MSDPNTTIEPADASGPADVSGRAALTAGGLLKAARQAQGLHIAMLAASLKVPQGKLESLEADRYDQLPDATFTRALAHSMCRALKIDPAAVLAHLPLAAHYALERVDGGLNTPFRERPGREEPSERTWWRTPTLWAVCAILLAAALLTWWPRGVHLTQWLPQGWLNSTPAPAERPPADLGQAPGAAPSSTLVTPAGASPAPTLADAAQGNLGNAAAAMAAPGAASDAAAPLALLRASRTSWVEVAQADGQVLLSRQLQAGETAAVQGRLPLAVRIGNAADTQLEFRGQAIDLRPLTRDNVARLELN